MKTIIYAILIILIISCSKKESVSNDDNNLVGKWELFEMFASDGANGSFFVVDENDRYSFTFFNDLTYTIQDLESVCLNGVYEILSNNLKLYPINENCNDETFILNQINENLITLNELPISCDEGCSLKFKRI